MLGPLLRPARGRLALALMLAGAALVVFLRGWPFWAGVGLVAAGWLVAATGLAQPPRTVKGSCRCGGVARDAKRCLACGTRL